MIKKVKFKQTPIGKIPKEWEVVNLDDVAYINKASIDPTKELLDKKFFYIDIDSVENGTGAIKDTKEIIGRNAPSRARRVIHYNDILMSTVRPYLRAFTIVPQKLNKQICSTGFAVLTCKESLHPLYLLYSILSKFVIDQCNKMMVGGQYPALSASQVKQIKILLPPVPEQKKIAEVLSTVDSAIQKVNEAIENSQRLKKGLMQELLTKGIGHDVKAYRDTPPIGKIPKEWAVVKLGDISLDLLGGGTPSTSDTNYWNGNIPWMTSAFINRREVNAGQKYITKEGLKGSAANLIPKENLLIATRVGIGKAALNRIDIAISQDLTGVIVNKNKALPDYLYWFFINSKEKLKSLAQGSTIKGILRDDLSKIKLPLPPLHEQNKIAEILSSVDEKLELLRVRKEKFTRLKNGLMNELLTGKKRVKV